MKPEIVSLIDSIDVTLNAGGMNTINIVLAFVMYGVALGIKPRMFVEVFKKPKSVLVGACSQIILLPLFTFLLALALGSSISWTMAMGMILVASCPGGNISNFISSLSKANIELSVSLTAISTALAILTTPFNFWFYGNLYMNLAGIAGPKIAEKLKKPMQIFSILFFIAMIVLSFMGNIDAFLKCIKYIFLIVLVHNLLALLLGYGTSSAFRLNNRDRRTITIETGIQNSGLGLVLLLGTSIFADFPPHGGTLVITAWWGIWHIISGLTAALLFNLSDRRKSRTA